MASRLADRLNMVTAGFLELSILALAPSELFNTDPADVVVSVSAAADGATRRLALEPYRFEGHTSVRRTSSPITWQGHRQGVGVASDVANVAEQGSNNSVEDVPELVFVERSVELPLIGLISSASTRLRSTSLIVGMS